MGRGWIPLSVLFTVTLIVASGSDVALATDPGPGPYAFAFDGNPASPQPWTPSTWDVAINSRDTGTFGALEGMDAQHGADCSAPPATHFNSSYEGAVFICRNHVMTAINASGYGEIVLTPDHMVDLSDGAAQVMYSVSTYRASFRDWYDVWFTPFADNLVLPLNAGLENVDLQGPPRNAIHIKLDTFNGGSIFYFEEYSDFRPTQISGDWWTSIESLVPPSAATRTQFEVDLSTSHLRFGIPNLPGGPFWWVDSELPYPLSSTRYVVQLAHHSYNPTKDCAKGTQHCLPDTWHWSSFSISKAVPFTMLRGDLQVVHAGTTSVVNFPAPAPQGSFLRFAAVGSIDVSVDGGKTWKVASRQAQSLDVREHFSSYWTPVPPGTRSVMIRGHDWYAGPWWVRDVSIWSSSQDVPRVVTLPSILPTSRPAVAPAFRASSWLNSNLTPIAEVAAALFAGFGLGYLIFGMPRRRRRRF